MNAHDNSDIDHLPFEEHAKIIAERGYAEFGDPNKPMLTFEQLAASDLTFDQIEAEYGEETAINAGIARDPDTWEWTDEDFARARPYAEQFGKVREG